MASLKRPPREMLAIQRLSTREVLNAAILKSAIEERERIHGEAHVFVAATCRYRERPQRRHSVEPETPVLGTFSP